MLLPNTVNLDEAIASSFRDYHVKGFDYLCLKRSPKITDKIYFFDGDVSNLSEVVNPHDHRYPFMTRVLAGRSQNSMYERNERGDVYYGFRFFTPLNGGHGFEEDESVRLLETSRLTYGEGDSCMSASTDIHTIRIVQDRTILWLRQFEDEVGVGDPTLTFSLLAKAPSLDGLYGRMTADDVLAKLRVLREVADLRIAVQA